MTTMPAKLIICLFFSLLASVSSYSHAASHIFGRIEYVTLGTFNDRLKAKLDTGAKTSSISAINIKHFEKNGKPWVRFVVVQPKKNLALNFSRPLLRTAKIKNRSSENADKSLSSERPVVSLTVCLRNTLQDIEVNLVDRRHFLYPMLLGTDAIAQFDGLVDPAQVFTIRPTCLKSS
jgi:hypothetical protein